MSDLVKSAGSRILPKPKSSTPSDDSLQAFFVDGLLDVRVDWRKQRTAANAARLRLEILLDGGTDHLTHCSPIFQWQVREILGCSGLLAPTCAREVELSCLAANTRSTLNPKP